eukprot:UN06699
MSATNEEPNCEGITLEAIKDNIHSVVVNKNKNIVQFILKKCRLVSIDYDDKSVKLSLDLPSIYSSVDEDNMLSKLELLKESSNEMNKEEEEDIKQYT